MEKGRKVKIIGIVALVLGVLGLTIAFAALSKTLRINGSGNIDRANWDIHFKNVTFVSKSATAQTSGTPSPTNNEKGPTITGLNVTLKQPNDYVTYTADIKNEGDIDASIDVVTPPSLTDRQNELFTFKAEYTEEQSKGTKVIEHGDILRAGETKNITITFRYNDITDASKLPSSPEAINLTYSILYVQAFESSTTQAPSNPSSADTYNQGDEFCLNNDKECFYVLSDNGETVTALAKYNLLFGEKNWINPSDYSITNSEDISTSDPEYGIQSSKTVPNFNDMTISGVVAFSSCSADYNQNRVYGYWAETSGEHALKSSYGSDYPAWVFDSNSYLWTPVQNYQSYLRNTLGKTSVTATLLTYEQSLQNGCVSKDTACSGFITNTSFWFGTANTQGTVYGVDPLPNLSQDATCNSNYFGIRPVITINKSEI